VPILPLSNDIKTASKFPRVLGEVVLANFVAQKRDGQRDRQTDRQTKTRHFWLPRRSAKSKPHQTWHGDSGSQARSKWCKVYCPHALADGNQRIRIREKTLEFSSTVSYIHTYIFYLSNPEHTNTISTYKKNERTLVLNEGHSASQTQPGKKYEIHCLGTLK